MGKALDCVGVGLCRRQRGACCGRVGGGSGGGRVTVSTQKSSTAGSAACDIASTHTSCTRLENQRCLSGKFTASPSQSRNIESLK